MVPMMVEVGQRLVNKWNEVDPFEEVDVKQYFKLATLDFIGGYQQSLINHQSKNRIFAYMLFVMS